MTDHVPKPSADDNSEMSHLSDKDRARIEKIDKYLQQLSDDDRESEVQYLLGSSGLYPEIDHTQADHEDYIDRNEQDRVLTKQARERLLTGKGPAVGDKFFAAVAKVLGIKRSG